MLADSLKQQERGVLLDLGVLIVWTVAVSYSVVIGISDTALKTLYQGAYKLLIASHLRCVSHLLALQTMAQWLSGWVTVSLVH